MHSNGSPGNPRAETDPTSTTPEADTTRDADPRPADPVPDGDAETSPEVRQGDRTGGPAETREEIDAELAGFRRQTRDAIAEVPGPDDVDSPAAQADRPGEPDKPRDEPAAPDVAEAKPEPREHDRDAPPASGTDDPENTTPDELAAALPPRPNPPSHAGHWLTWRRRHQARSRWFHQRTRLNRDNALVR